MRYTFPTLEPEVMNPAPSFSTKGKENGVKTIKVNVPISILIGLMAAAIPFLSGLVVGAGIERSGGKIELREKLKQAIVSGKAQKVDIFFIAQDGKSTKKNPASYIWLANKEAIKPTSEQADKLANKEAGKPASWPADKLKGGSLIIAGAGDQGMRKVAP
jgi:hypothetical protein